ncbi:putative isomerase YbhE [Daedaleopsis nitida]|nr:putative isomerase YbhE [Daedaleopsis nitida]
MVNFTILAGGFSSFIASYVFDSDANTLTLLGQNPTGQNPSWIALHPTNKSILYFASSRSATNENTDGALQSFVVKSDGLLTEALSQVSTAGNGPAFAIPLSTGEVAGMNFGGGNGVIVSTQEDPTQFVTGSPAITFGDATTSHPHMALEVGSEVFVPDLGLDRIWRLSKDAASGLYQIVGQIDQAPKSGPRHIVVRGDQLYTVHEDDSTLTQQTIPSDPSDSAATVTANFSVVLLAEASNTTGSPFTQPFLYVSNRNTGTTLDPRGDAIAIYAVEPALQLVKHVFTGLDQIRGMQLSGGSENAFLVAAGVAGTAGTVVLKRTHGGADLEIVAKNAEVPTRSSFVWVEDV